MTAERLTYIDSSAIVKLVIEEPESAALRHYLRRRRPLVASALAGTEVSRAVVSMGADALHRTHEVLSAVDLVDVTAAVLADAATLSPIELRTLDAIHLATALRLGATLFRFVCCDERLSGAAAEHGWVVASPS